jgi:hypothetical protein
VPLVKPDSEEADPFAGLSEFSAAHGSRSASPPPPPPRSTPATPESELPCINIRPSLPNRSKTRPIASGRWLLIASGTLFGAGLGLLASYWCQPSFYRAFVPLGSYVSDVPRILSHVAEFNDPDPRSPIKGSLLGAMARTMVVTALVGTFVGFVLSLLTAQHFAKGVQLRNAVRVFCLIVIVSGICLAAVIAINTGGEIKANKRRIVEFYSQQKEAAEFLSGKTDPNFGLPPAAPNKRPSGYGTGLRGK